MGARGQGYKDSSRVKGLSVDVGGGQTLEYRQINNKIYRLDNGTPEATNIKSFNQIIDGAKSQGYKIEKYTQKDLNKMEKAREADRKEVDKFLDNAYVKNKVAGQVNKSYRSHKQSIRISRRRR